MLVLHDASVRYLQTCVVHDGIALIIVGRHSLLFKVQTSVFEMSQFIAEELVNTPCEDYVTGQMVEIIPISEIIAVGSAFHPIKQSFNKLVVASHRNSLPCVIEIIVVIGEAHRKPSNDGGWQFAAWAPPLFFGIAPYQFLVDIASDETYGLFLKIARTYNSRLISLSLNLLIRFLRFCNAPHLIESVHIEGQVIKSPIVICDGV